MRRTPSELLNADKAILWAKLHLSASSLMPPKPMADGTVFAFAPRITLVPFYLLTKRHGALAAQY